MQHLPDRFNVRVYGIWLTSEHSVLVADELISGYKMTKFPGGGLQFGEGLADGLKREWMEELNVEINITNLLYINDFYQPSAFRKQDQILSVYYLIEPVIYPQIEIASSRFQFHAEGNMAEPQIRFRWLPVHEASAADLTFPIDQKVLELLQAGKSR